MTERSLLWEDAGGGDGGPYSSDEMRLMFTSLGSAFSVNEGVIGGAENSLRPSSPGNDQIKADTGRAIVDGTLYENDVAVTKTMTTPSVGTTGKQLVVRKLWAGQTIRLYVVSSADGTPGIPALTQTDLTEWQMPICSFTHAVDGTIAAITDLREFTNPRIIPFFIDGGGGALSPGIKGLQKIPFDFEVTGWEVLPDQSGSIVVDIWEDAYANYPPTDADSITGGDEPTVTATTKAQNLDVATEGNWTLKLTKGNILYYNVDSITTCEWALILIIGAGD